MRILITGEKGFVGSETVRLLKEHGHDVIGYDLMDGFDIRDKEQLNRALQGNVSVYGTTADRILHLAAIARFSDADANPRLAFETNVEGTRNVAEVAAKYHIPLVYASTGSAIMPLNSYEPPFSEEIPARGNSVYGTTKAMGEYYVREHTPHIILRYAHLYGAEKRFHGLIGGYLSRIERGLAPELYGGRQTNSFVYIKDIARANLLALEADWDKYNQAYNVGSNQELSAEDAGNMVCEVFGYTGEVIKKEQRTVDASRFQFDISKIERMLGWKPEFSFKEGLQDMQNQIKNEQ